MSELRFNPLIGEWLATATHRQDRTFLPPAGFCPLCPTEPGGFPTEIAEPDYDIVVFENRFPSLKSDPPEPAIEGNELYKVAPGQGVCEVVVYSPNHTSSLAAEPVEQILKLIRVWRHRTAAIEALDFVKYVYIFENKGEAVGVTLHHPHGQIYAYPFVPPIIQKEILQMRSHAESTGRCLLCDVVRTEREFATRVVAGNDSFVAVIPFYARYPYETHILSTRHLQSFTDLTEQEERDLAELMKQLLEGFDRLFEVSFPYVMAVHQRPAGGDEFGFYHFHIEFYPPMRTANKLKYLAGSEIGAGMFINDTLPEQTAPALRALVRPVEWGTAPKQ